MASKNRSEKTTERTQFPFKLAAIDIDQTLVGPDKKIGALNRSAVHRLKDLGCRVILASGRRHDNMLSYHRSLGLDGFIVSTQGAMARHSTSTLILHEALVLAVDAAAIMSAGLERNLTVMHWSRRGVAANERSRWVEQYIEDCRDPVQIVDLGAQGSGAGPAEKVVWSGEPALIARYAAMAAERYRGRFEVTRTEDYSVEFTALDATKAAGVAAVAKHHEIDASAVLTFGDGNNDVSMLRWAGTGVAMAHARPAAKAAAKLIAPDGDPESSFARAVDAVLSQTGFGDAPQGIRLGALNWWEVGARAG